MQARRLVARGVSADIGPDLNRRHHRPCRPAWARPAFVGAQRHVPATGPTLIASRHAPKPSARARHHACATTVKSSANDASECPATNASTCGSIAAIPPCTGW